MANQFSVPVPSILDALAQVDKGYATGRRLRTDGQIDEARRGAAESIAAGGNRNSVISQLMGAGDIQGLNAYNQSQNNASSGVFGTPIYGRDPATGQTVLGAIARDGTFRKLDTGGVQVTPGVQWQDFGTYRQPFDRSGNPAAPPVMRQGDIPQGHIQAPDGGGVSPMVGSPQERQAQEAVREQQQSQQKEVARAAQTATTGKLVIDDIDRAIGLVGSGTIYNPAAGFGAETAAKYGGTLAANTASLLETIKANIGFDRLQRMRDESPTGGALGQVAVQELTALQSTMGSVSQAQSPKQLVANLKRLKTQYESIMRKVSAYPNAAKYGFGTGDKAPTGVNPATPPQRVQSVQDAMQLAPGTRFIDPNGVIRIVPQRQGQ